MVYEPRLTREYAEVYRSTEANIGPEALNLTITATADLGLLGNSTTPSGGEFPENPFEAEAIATGWVAALQGVGW
jgi:hypothetical protein